MARTSASGLSEHAFAVCGQCGDPIWIYATPAGASVALDNAPGPYVIHERKAYKATQNLGFQAHWDHCKSITSSLRTWTVLTDEFLWP
jgi:hypothetical protein